MSYIYLGVSQSRIKLCVVFERSNKMNLEVFVGSVIVLSERPFRFMIMLFILAQLDWQFFSHHEVGRTRYNER